MYEKSTQLLLFSMLLKGECIVEEGKFICRCELGWTGEDCSVRSHNFCQSDTCFNNATCVDDETGFSCICDHQFTGKWKTLDLTASSQSKLPAIQIVHLSNDDDDEDEDDDDDKTSAIMDHTTK